jgi:hypothetical protein
MIEPSRRHGHFDPRFSIQRAAAERPRANGPTDIEELPLGLDWVAFTGRLFPGRRSHDFEALKAYEAYKDRSHRPKEEPATLDLVGAA